MLGSERQAEILRVLHHDTDTDEPLSSTWDTMRVWAWCSHYGLPLLGQVALASGLDGKEVFRIVFFCRFVSFLRYVF